MVRQKPLAKIWIELEPDAWHGCPAETVWAERVGDDRYRILNFPFFAFGVSFQDVIFARSREDGALAFSGVSLRGGHSTYRLFLKVPMDSAAFREHWQPLQELGCRYEEGFREKLLAVDVPPAADIYEVYALFQRGEDAGVWEFEEGHCGHRLHRGEATGETR